MSLNPYYTEACALMIEACRQQGHIEHFVNISDYELNPTDDVYAQKIDDKRIYIVFNKRLKSNFGFFLYIRKVLLNFYNKIFTLFVN